MPDTHSPFRRKATAWFSASGVAGGSAAMALGCLVAMSAQAQAIRPEGPRAAQAPVAPPAAAASSPEEPVGPANRRLDAVPGTYGGSRSAGAADAPARTLKVESSVAVSFIGDDNVNLTPDNKRRDLIVEVSPRLSLSSQGARHRLNGSLGVDHTEYTRDSKPTLTRPVADMSLQSMLVDNAFYLDGGARVERRAASPFGPQSTGVATDEQIDTRVYTLSPRLDMHPGLGWSALLRSDNTWTNRASDTVALGPTAHVYSRRTRGHFNRDPEPFGYGIEGSEESLRYDDDRTEVLSLRSLRGSLGYKLSPQFSMHVLAGAEHSRYAAHDETDSDIGLRLRWAPLERSVLSLEARRRFFGNGFNAQWNHQSRMFSLSISGSREPVTQPEALHLAGDVGQQFTAFYQAQGYSPAQVQERVQQSLAAVNQQQGLVDPVTVYVNSPQLATAGNVSLALNGRRTVVVLSVYGRRLERLQGRDDAVAASLPSDLDQRGSQLSVSYRLTPMVTLDTFARYDHSESSGGPVVSESTDTLFSASSGYWLSPHLRVTLGAQHHRLKSTQRAGGAAAANVGTATVLYRF